ncbi:MAG: hypothetical protein WDA27_02250 [Actinomycetota bacterium]
MHRWKQKLRPTAVLVGVPGVILALSMPALASFTTNTVGCKGHATITSSDGKKYEIDAKDVAVTLPKEGNAAWSGSTTPISHDHHGSVGIDFGFIKPAVGKWASENLRNTQGSSGVKHYEIPSWVPGGKIKVFGTHVAKEGMCSGSVEVTLDGGAGPVGFASLALTVAFGAMLISAGKGKP